MSDIEARLTRVERSVRRWRIAAGALVVVAVVSVAFGAQRQPTKLADEIAARRIIVENRQGKPVIVLDANAEGDGVIAVFDRTKKHTAMISVKDNGASIHTSDNDRPVFFAGADDDGKVFITLSDKTGKTVWQKRADAPNAE